MEMLADIPDPKNVFVESETQTYHGRNGSGRRKAARRGGAGPSKTVHPRVGSPRTQPTLLAPQGIEDNCPERFPGRTNKG